MDRIRKGHIRGTTQVERFGDKRGKDKMFWTLEGYAGF